MSQEDVERLDEDEPTVEEHEDETPDAEGHRFLAAERAADPGAHTAHTVHEKHR
ncbi:MAG TPA: hypothetical protein VKS25_15655 [Solirubrobacteraceae bacterium]|nr:hypothetical protein [Solirubrobacteraceae bacterium]